MNCASLPKISENAGTRATAASSNNISRTIRSCALTKSCCWTSSAPNSPCGRSTARRRRWPNMWSDFPLWRCSWSCCSKCCRRSTAHRPCTPSSRKVASCLSRSPRMAMDSSARALRGARVSRRRPPKLERIVAIKTIVPQQFESDSAVRRFQVEAEAAAKLDHPGVVPIYDVGEQDGEHYLCMAYVDGESLATRLARGPLPADDAARIVRDVAEAVHHAHERGIIHRDLKPANILIDNAGRPRVTDFGLARKQDFAGSLTADGSVIGTPAYMSPEQATG